MALIEGIKVDGGLLKEAGGAVKEALEGIGGIFGAIRSAITGKVDPKVEAEILAKIDEGEKKLQQGQVDINKIEAASSSTFVAGWRPFIGWVCGSALVAYYIPQALMASCLWTIQCLAAMCATKDITVLVLPPFPLSFDIGEIVGLVTSLLGLGYLRTKEKTAGVAR